MFGPFGWGREEAEGGRELPASSVHLQLINNYQRLGRLVGPGCTAGQPPLNPLPAGPAGLNVCPEMFFVFSEIYNSSDLASLGGSLESFTTSVSLPIIDTILPIWREGPPTLDRFDNKMSSAENINRISLIRVNRQQSAPPTQGIPSSQTNLTLINLAINSVLHYN